MAPPRSEDRGFRHGELWMNFLKSGFSFGGPLPQILPNELWTESLQANLVSPPENTDHHFMFEALKESLTSIGLSNPNPAVGCVLVDAQGQEIARGATQAYLGPHAERVAFSKISGPQGMERLDGADSPTSPWSPALTMAINPLALIFLPLLKSNELSSQEWITESTDQRGGDSKAIIRRQGSFHRNQSRRNYGLEFSIFCLSNCETPHFHPKMGPNFRRPTRR